MGDPDATAVADAIGRLSVEDVNILGVDTIAQRHVLEALFKQDNKEIIKAGEIAKNKYDLLVGMKVMNYLCNPSYSELHRGEYWKLQVETLESIFKIVLAKLRESEDKSY